MAPESEKRIEGLETATNALSLQILDLKTTLLNRWEEEEKNLRKIRLGVIVAACIGVAASVVVAVVISLIGHQQIHTVKKTAHDALENAVHQRIAICEASNRQKAKVASETRKHYQPKMRMYESEHAHPDPVIDGILKGLANAQPLITNCRGTS